MRGELQSVDTYEFEVSSLDEFIHKVVQLLKRERKREGRYKVIVWIAPVHNNTAYEIKQYIDQNFTKIRTMQDVVNATKYSYPTIARYFKKCYGITPMKYIRGLKKSYAKLLRSQGMPWKQIAYKLGYKYVQNLKRMIKDDNI